MANPQAENGHIDIAHEIAEQLARINLSAYESRILWAIFRKTYGWHKKEDRISVTQFQKITGLKRRHVQRTLKTLIRRNLVTSKGASFITTYGFQKDYTKWKTVTPKGYTSPDIKTVTSIGYTPAPNEVTILAPIEVHTKEKKETLQKKESTPFSLSNGKDNTKPELARVQCRFCQKGYYVKDAHECSEIDLEKLKQQGMA